MMFLWLYYLPFYFKVKSVIMWIQSAQRLDVHQMGKELFFAYIALKFELVFTNLKERISYEYIVIYFIIFIVNVVYIMFF